MDDIQSYKSYSPQQVADLLGYKVATIYALLSRGEMIAGREGRNRVISVEQINDFINRRRKLDQIIDYTK
jgi:excisionase family DNA binding protein